MSKAFISVGIDVGADFSYMSLALPDQTFIGKPFKIVHNNDKSLEQAVQTIKKAEELNSMKARIVMESTGIYHYPLFYYLCVKGFETHVINPIITKNSTNLNVRKVSNDKSSSKIIAILGLKPDLKTSLIPADAILDLRNIAREYYSLVDERSSYVNKLLAVLRIAFPQYLGVFSKITGKAALALLAKYPSPRAFLSARKSSIIKLIRKKSRSGVAYAEKKYQCIIKAAKAASTFGHALSSNAALIKNYISIIRMLDKSASDLLTMMEKIVKDNEGETFAEHIRLLETIPGCGFLSAVTVICEIGDFTAFKSPKQLFAYFGLDPAVKQSGNFTGTNVKMSKRGSSVARRVVYTIALVSIGRTCKGKDNNRVLREYYLAKCKSKPKMVALGAIMHKVCNIIFAVLRDLKPFTLTTAEQHRANFSHISRLAA